MITSTSPNLRVPPILHSLHYLNMAVSEPSPEVPEFMTIGYLDGIPFVRYDSKRGRGEPGYWDWMTQTCERNQHMDAWNLEMLQDQYNQSRDEWGDLWVYGCDLLSDGNISGSSRFGYDGQDFISFDPGSRRFVAANSIAEVTRRRWEGETNEVEMRANYLEHVCPEWLQKYIGYGQKDPLMSIHVSGKEEHGTLILSCHAYRFYPSTIAVNWMKGDEFPDQEMEWGRVVPNSNGTFHTWARIEARLEEREQYWCRVEHPGMSEPGIFTWGKLTSGGNLTVVVAVSIAAIIILIVVIRFVVWRCQSSIPMEFHGQISPPSHSSGNSMGRSHPYPIPMAFHGCLSPLSHSRAP
uniref:Ig-like domain-containing protein n=1 Tax=Ficedula albicollis TaxID=59894 RepID=U3JB89_FICAL